jgi:hypothetical protein
MRMSIIEFLKKELIGPDPIPPLVQENGEEILVNEPPRQRYGAGILFPQESLYENCEATNSTEEELIDQHVDEEPEDETVPYIEIEGERFSSGTDDESSDVVDDTINLTNSRLQSAMGFSCFLKIPDEGLCVDISAGRYKSGEISLQDNEGNSYLKKAFFRESLDTQIHIKRDDLPKLMGDCREFPVVKDGEETGLYLHVTKRYSVVDHSEGELFTFTLINRLSSPNSTIDNERCFFQVEFSVKSKFPCFLPYPQKRSIALNEDEKSNRLLYRNRKTYAIGHGCSPTWQEEKGHLASSIKTESIPTFEMKPIVPTVIPGVTLSMLEMSDLSEMEDITSPLSIMCGKYRKWIKEQEELASEHLEGELKETADKHIDNCRRCLDRMEEGIRLIKSDPVVNRAFRLMNRSMLMQQLRYALELREWRVGKNGETIIDKGHFPDLKIRESWPDWPDQKLGLWRPFQIAFILMNIKSMAVPEDPERELVDIIWFPTGGGKTEAYLGLTAYTIFLRRLRNPDNSGTAVLMRYTLRLLTAQQFQRAASLICACEIIRKEHESELGSERITIGLWVGESLTPNKRSDARKAIKELQQNKSEDNPFVVLKCPWCGAQMGQVKCGKEVKIKGYRDNLKTIVFQCHDSDCDFSKHNFTLPLLIIDEDIYENPPTLIIGTVDKFAMLPWKPEAKSLFGRRRGINVAPPELIIQDELHLISGPLGSMVGHYETLISELCRNDMNGGVKAKIVASTATISQAREQAHALYNCGKDNVFQFPPQCIDAGESFFAYEEKEAPGRLYVGIHATALPSHATTQIRVISSLLQAAKSVPGNEKDRNYYWTILNYFNSIRELGHAATLVRADISEYLRAMWNRKGIHKENRRFIDRAIELTSRISNSEIPRSLQALEISYPSKEIQKPVDICLATNMISVGVDVPRLGLMTVIGQPKTTSEYIQATSRVGRAKEGPGLVVVIYNPSKPRDRSLYEHFVSYHSTIYSQVEPTSVTPFSAPVRERALHALLVGFVRYLSDRNSESPQPMPDSELIRRIESIIAERVYSIDTDEADQTIRLLMERINEWRRYLPSRYGDFAPPSPILPLMYPAGTTPLDEWDDKPWPTPSSMRNVDASCEARILANYSFEEN